MQVKDVCMIVQGCSFEEVHYRHLAGFFVWMCMEVSLCVGLYKDVDI